MKRMQLITKAIERKAPRLYDMDEVPAERTPVVAKFFTPDSSFTWYMVEYDAESRIGFGFVTSNLCPEGELGYFSITEMESVCGPQGLPVERDLYYRPHSLKEVMDGDPGAR